MRGNGEGTTITVSGSDCCCKERRVSLTLKVELDQRDTTQMVASRFEAWQWASVTGVW